MKKLSCIIFFIIFYVTCFTGCKKPYAPPAIKVDNRFLVIDGVLVNSIDSPSVFTLSRTTRLTDSTTSSSPEPGAQVSVEGSTGEIFNFQEQPNGIYKADHILLNTSNKYRLKIVTSSGSQYASDFVDVKQTPPIDSLKWEQQNDVHIYLDSHDPLNNTRYYRWDFAETWEYVSLLDAELSQDNGILFYVDATNQTHTCWHTTNSTELLLGSTIALSEDVINKAPIAIVPQNDEKISIRYSILVKQYAIAADAYQYFSILKKNTENLGSIFDAQPTQLTGNIHSVKNPSEIVIGFFTASSATQKRIFISKYDVANWNYVDTGRECGVMTIGHDPNNFFVYDYPDPDYDPYFFSGSTSLVIARKSCVDCRLKGGVNQKPSYW